MNSLDIICNANYAHIEELKKIRVNRDKEVKDCLETLKNTTLNIYIYGPRGIGKTFLIKTVQNELKQVDSSIFSFSINMAAIAFHGEAIQRFEFISSIALSMISRIWSELCNMEQSTIFSEIDSNTFAEPKTQYLHRLYNDITHSRTKFVHLANRQQLENGNKKEILNWEIELERFNSSEVLKIIEELRGFLITTENKRKIVVFCDEANILDAPVQKEFVTKHLDIFTNLGMQFLFVGGYFVHGDEYNVPDYFEYILHLKGIEHSHIRELFSKYFPTYEITIDDECAKYMCNKTYGNIRQIINITHRAVLDHAIDSKVALNKKTMQRGFRELEEMTNKLRNPFSPTRINKK